MIKKIAVIASYSKLFKEYVSKAKTENTLYIMVSNKEHVTDHRFDAIEYCLPYHPKMDVNKLTELCKQRLINDQRNQQRTR